MTESTRGRLEIKFDEHGKIVERNHLASHPANPVLHLGNSKRSPEPVRDLMTQPDLTGRYFETEGRYRLFINHAGPRLEMLLTLVTQDWLYGTHATALEQEVRIPKNWVRLDQTKTHVSGRPCKPLAFRLSGIHVAGGLYALEIPFWADNIPADYPVELLSVGTLSCESPGLVELRLGPDFLQNWPFHGDLDCSRAKQRSSDPVLLEAYLDHPSVPFVVRTLEWFELTPQQRDGMHKALRNLVRLPIKVNQHGLPASEGEGGTELLDIHGLLDREIQLERLGAIATLKRRNILLAVDALVEKIVDGLRTGAVEQGAVGSEHFDEFRAAALAVLDDHTFISTNPAVSIGEKSLLFVLLRALDRNSQGQTYPALEKYLGLRGRGWRKHRYSMGFEVFSLAGAKALNEFKKQIDEMLRKVAEHAKKKLVRVVAKIMQAIRKSPVKTLVGFLDVRYEGVVERYDDGKAHPLLHEEPWEARYWVLLGGGEAKKTSGEGLKSTWTGAMEMWSNDDPLPQDLEGKMTLSDLKIYAGANAEGLPEVNGGTLTAGGHLSILQIWGKGGHGLQFTLTGGKIDKPGAGAGASLSAMYGTLELIESSSAGTKLPEPELPLPVTYWENAVPSLALHFEVNGARFIEPTEAEQEKIKNEKRLVTRDALAAFAAYELPLLSHPLAKLEIIGHADMPDTEERNQELSINRAESIYNLLRSFLGDRLLGGASRDVAEKDERLIVVGAGEREASKTSGASESVYDRRYRRSDVRVYLGAIHEKQEDVSAVTWPMVRDDKAI